jgi:hypothetical protein
MKNKIQYFVAIALLALISLSTTVLAQPDPGTGGDPGGGPPVGGGAGAPIGGGVGILVAFGIAYAVSRYTYAKKEE